MKSRGTVMLRSRRVFIQTSLSGSVGYRSNRPAFSLCLLISLKNISHSRTRPSRAVVSYACRCHLPRHMAPPTSVALYPALCPLGCRAVLHPSPCPLQLARVAPLLLHAALCPVLHVCRGAARVLPTSSFPTIRLWLLLTPWPPRHVTLARICCNDSACCKHMFQVLDVSEVCCNCFIWMLQVDRGCCICCKCFRGLFKMFHIFEMYVASILI
jgi:hypothetical protein